MINRLIDVALRNRFIVVVVYLGLAGWGIWLTIPIGLVVGWDWLLGRLARR